MPVTMSSVDLERLSSRFMGMQMRLSTLQGRVAELSARQTKLAHDVSIAKGRRDLAPAAMAAFTYLREKAHAKAVGDFEALLTDFVQDVIPGEGSVRLELGMERGAPSLDIMLDNYGDLEEIYSGNGGGLTNVVVTALGFSALSRTRNRQLMLLDEPDCWLKAQNVPAFTRVIAEVSNPHEEDGVVVPGCQTLMVSHNDITLMDEGAHIQNVQVDKNLSMYAKRLGADVRYVGVETTSAHVIWVPNATGNGHIEVRYRAAPADSEEKGLDALEKGFAFIDNVGGARAWDESMPGVRWIEVENLRRHLKTRLELSSGLNVLTGGVNSGKSTLLFTALRAMAYGESDDTLIRHGADSAVIRLGLEGGVVLEMVRNRKGSPKVIYRRYVDGVRTNEGGQERKSVPNFITESLRIATVDDMDIQLRHQKQPVFLLNEPASRRAQLLSVGKESGLLQAMIEKHRLNVTRDNAQIKRDEAELNEVNRTLKVLAPLASLTAIADILQGMMADAKETSDQLSKARTIVGRLTMVEGKAKLGIALDGKFEGHMTPPSTVDTTRLHYVIHQLTVNSGRAQLPDMPEVPMAPVLHSTRALLSLIEALSTTGLRAELPDLPQVPLIPELADTRRVTKVIGLLRHGDIARIGALMSEIPSVPDLLDTREIRRSGIQLSRGAESVRKLTADDNVVAAEQEQAEAALADMKAKLGVCPLCNHAFDGHNHD